MDRWDNYHKINEELKKEFLCIPPYSCITGKFVGELFQKLESSDRIKFKGQIIAAIRNPAQRAYQMEYKYKNCKIFTPYMSIIEYAMYDMFNGNYVCAYLSLLPIIEAVFREWAKEEPELSFNKMKGFAPKLVEHLKEQEFFPDDRINITNAHIEYLQFILCEVLYIDFDAYEEKEFSIIFNRNLTLHKLQGATDFWACSQNINRLLLLLDIIAELYFMQTPSEYWAKTFYAEPEKNLDYQIHKKLYQKLAMYSLGPNDLLYFPNVIFKDSDDATKELMIKQLDMDIEMLRIFSEKKRDEKGV